ncbi:cupin domain-containing protein [Paenibacillus fonticola]|uniref:cupin domain-containing protein n=1 Tax=Paenibacillus fonticola TaxID=379896 RepID=UPI0003816C67|nr:cupin domain-containing protein [Paenibacillus fonticola]
MIIRNYLEAESKSGRSHSGQGEVQSVKLFHESDFESSLKFLYYMVMPPGTSIGYHQHGENEELYIILEGSGQMTVNGEIRDVKAGDVILNKRNWSHGLENTAAEPLRLLVYEADL